MNARAIAALRPNDAWQSAIGAAIGLAERGLVPDPLVRWAIRRMIAGRLRDQAGGGDRSRDDLVRKLRAGPIALHVRAANQQHYEVPPAFFAQVLGPRLKYSACHWPAGVASLEQAEESMLDLTCRRAELADGMSVLDLGCGWGSLSFWIAEHYPRCRVLAVSNSAPQRMFIEAQARRRGIDRIEVVTADMNEFAPARRFDRVISVEMFEHMRNYELLLARIAGWLEPDGRLFAHFFSHRTLAYPFEPEGPGDWMARTFFTGGLMPSHDLLLSFQRDLVVEERWRSSGLHYWHTLEAWLARLDRSRGPVLDLFREVYGADAAERWFVRWRLFFLGCAEMFAYGGGAEWGISHLRFRRA